MIGSDICPSVPESWDECRVMICGESPGKDEVRERQPFVGMSGRLLTERLELAGLPRKNLYITNVFWTRPPDNKVEYFFVGPVSAQRSEKYPNSFKNLFLNIEYDDEIDRLSEEIKFVKPELIIAVGAVPTWALTGYDLKLPNNITNLRGKIYPASGPVGCDNVPVLPTFHPSYVLRTRKKNIPVLDADLKLAASL